jgi:hypothetical protein
LLAEPFDKRSQVSRKRRTKVDLFAGDGMIQPKLGGMQGEPR